MNLLFGEEKYITCISNTKPIKKYILYHELFLTQINLKLNISSPPPPFEWLEMEFSKGYTIGRRVTYKVVLFK